MKKPLLILLTIVLSSQVFSQSDPIVVTEQTVKVGNEKELLYAFAEGDELIFDLQVIKGKNLKEVEIIEHPHSSKLFEFKTSKVAEKRIKVNKTAIYRFRIKGGGVGTKICRTKILRIPASDETANFDTSVKWKTRYDSTYTTKYRKKLAKVDTNVVVLADRTERVHSQTNLSHSNTSSFNINLPQNQKSSLATTEVVSWAYWIGVGDAGLAAYNQEKRKFLKNSAATLGSIEPISGLALGAYTMLSNPPKGDNVIYSFSAAYQNGTTVSLGQGNSIVASGRNTTVKQGGFTVRLKNDNMMNGINVTVKISAITVTKTYVNQPYQVLQVKEHRYPVMATDI